ncbi:hypothetical protein HN031_09335 [Nocardioides sp. zg-1308]|uniref:hypothetical protein n=1 Tax=Nocardioides sp. zg-1308 TaxID=2736253 RepID=UPI0015580032|nr:hypothetical protein [Nocardioides sp. zg-1308]NPD04882.1 hypothetical protein [Nocardioides sp. zg-1308]
MSASGDATTGPWTDPQTHLDTDPVNAEPSPGRRDDEDRAEDAEHAAHAAGAEADGDAGPVEPS